MTLRPDGRPVDILHDFYIPALQRSVRYDRVAGYFCSTSLAAASQGFSALVDEAHYARRKNPTAGSQAPPEYGYLYLAIEEALRPKARSLWLANATPMQLDAVEAADLLALTRRAGAFQYDPRLMQVYYETLSGLTSNRPLRTSEWAFLRRAVLAVEAEDPSLWAFLRQTVIDGRTRLAVRQWLDQGRPPRPADLSGVRRLIFAASPLSRVMLRHTRLLLEIYRQQGQIQDNLARRPSGRRCANLVIYENWAADSMKRATNRS